MRWRSLTVRVQSWDGGLAVLVAGFLLVAPIGVATSGAASVLAWMSGLAAGDPFSAYNDALAASAIKRPEYQRELATLDTAKVQVVTFGKPLSDSSEREFDIWVALKTQLQDACAGAVDPVLALQQILGLPPGAASGRVVSEFSISPDGLFRPCASNTDVSETSCGFDIPKPPAKLPAETPESPGTNDDLPRMYNELVDAHERLYFFANQMWSSYRMGFPRDGAGPSDYPYSGYPFTGMGWSYNWASSSPDHFGVSEFVVKRDADVAGVKTTSPAEFCASNGASEQPTE